MRRGSEVKTLEGERERERKMPRIESRKDEIPLEHSKARFNMSDGVWRV